MTFVVGCISPWFIEDFPEDCKFLTPTEKAQVVRRLEHDVGKSGEFRKEHIYNAFKDWVRQLSPRSSRSSREGEV